MKIENLRERFDKIRKEPKEKLLKVVKNFCETFLKDDRNRPVKLTPMQEDIITTSLQNQNVAVWAPRGSGKSFALAVVITIWLYFYRRGEEVYVLAPYMDQTKRIFTYVLHFFESTPELRKMIRHSRFDNSPILRLNDGSILKPRAVSLTNKGKAIRGQHATFVVVDESSYIGDDIFVPCVEPMVLRHSAPFVNVGTGFSKNNHFYRYLYDEDYAKSDYNPAGFERRFFNYKDGLIKGDAYEAAYSEEFIERKRREWASNPEWFDMEFNGKFKEEAGRFFSYEALKDKIFERYNLDRSNVGENYVSVDFGRMKNSTVISCFEKIWDAGTSKIKLKDIDEIIPKEQGMTFPFQRKKIIEMCRKYSVKELIIDATGMGMGQLDELKIELMEDDIRIVPFKFTGRGTEAKTNCYSDFKNFLQEGRIIFPETHYLVECGQLRSAKMIEKGMDELFDLSYEIRNSQIILVCLPRRFDDFPDSWMMAAVKILTRPKQEGHVVASPLRIFSSRRVDFEKNFKNWKEGDFEQKY